MSPADIETLTSQLPSSRRRGADPSSPMTHDLAVQILTDFNAWRRGADIPIARPRDIGLAMDFLLNEAAHLLQGEAALSACRQILRGGLTPEDIRNLCRQVVGPACDDYTPKV